VRALQGAVLSFLGVGALFSINGIASELEDPFDDTPNDLALEYHVSNFTDFMTELMCWLGEKSDGNVRALSCITKLDLEVGSVLMNGAGERRFGATAECRTVEAGVGTSAET
jgi:hypothetical protein